MRHTRRSNVTGKFIPKPTPVVPIVAGRLYSYKGIVVRAKRKCNKNLWLVSSHKKLNGFVRPEELGTIDKQEVKRYLDYAKP